MADSATTLSDYSGMDITKSTDYSGMNITYTTYSNGMNMNTSTDINGMDLTYSTDNTINQLTTPRAPLYVERGDIVDPATQVAIHRVVTCGLYQVVNIGGVFCNIINMIVFAKQGLRADRVNLSLFCLALVDTLNLLFSQLGCGQCWLSWFGDTVGAVNWTMVLIATVTAIYVYLPNLSIGILTLISVDRCLAVTFPLHATRYQSIRCSLVSMLVIAVVIFAPYVPLFFFYDMVWISDPASGHPLVILRPTKVATNPAILNTRDVCNIILKCGCFIVVLVSTITTVLVLRRASKARALMKSGGERGKGNSVKSADVKITVMLIVVAVIMEICLALDVAFGITTMIVHEFYVNRKYSNLYSVCLSFLFLARSVNSASNFFCYLALSTSFRTTLRSLGPCRVRVSKDQELRSGRSYASETVVSDMSSANN